MPIPSTDQAVRTATFAWLAKQENIHGEVLTRKLLETGFFFGDEQIHLVGPQGIFKPRILSNIPLSITTTSGGPYKDSFASDGLLSYSYRGTNVNHPDNVGLRRAMREHIPLVYFHSVVPGKYLAVWPVFIVGDNQGSLKFTVAVDDKAVIRMRPGEQPVQEVADEADVLGRRRYITRLVRTRLHQQGFRERVLRAYREQCACCRLRHEQLLDAAHIIPDVDPEGEPVVSNGLALCKLHHAAFDSFIIGITPDYEIRIRDDVLGESDGPMLQHGLQGLNGSKIIVPRAEQLQPRRELLEKRYEQFKKAG